MNHQNIPTLKKNVLRVWVIVVTFSMLKFNQSAILYLCNEWDSKHEHEETHEEGEELASGTEKIRVLINNSWGHRLHLTKLYNSKAMCYSYQHQQYHVYKKAWAIRLGRSRTSCTNSTRKHEGDEHRDFMRPKAVWSPYVDANKWMNTDTDCTEHVFIIQW